MKHIPIHKLHERANIGLELRYTSEDKIKRDGDLLGVHRDDHYIFFMIENGHAELTVDFTHIQLHEQSVYYMLPGQVHHRINSTNAEGWFLAVDTLLIPKEFRSIFEDHLLLLQPYRLSPQKYEQAYKLIRLLNEAYTDNAEEPFYLQLVYSLLNSFLGIVASAYSKDCPHFEKESRPKQIAQDFKRLLIENFRTEKSPSAYADKLNISSSYLNEALNKITGLPVSYWIIHEVMLEAKRLLYYSEMNVKEIAHDLGYEDHAYFSRLFKKANNITPLEFRSIYHK